MKVKRRRDETALVINKGITESDEQILTFCTSIMDLPEPIFIDILLRLPLKVILVCKCICKPWRQLIFSSQFANMHFDLSRTSLLLRNLDKTCVPRICYLVDPSEISTTRSSQGFDQELNVGLNVELKIPIRNPEVALDMEAVKKNRHVKLAFKDHKFKLVNSCKGFLCLSEPSRNEPNVVCNPVTGEFVNLPNGAEPNKDFVDCGFGFCPIANQYKLIRIFDTGVRVLTDSRIGEGKTHCRRMAQVHTLGTQSWKNVGYAPYNFGRLLCPTYHNGNLHWFYPYPSRHVILSFDFSKERFQNFPSPPSRYNALHGPTEFDHSKFRMNMSVLRGNLCFSFVDGNQVTIWVMEKYGESWTKLVNLDIVQKGFNYFCQLIDYLKCGSLLMFYYPNNIFIRCDIDTEEWDCLKVCGTKSKCEAITFVPSFLSLKEALQGDEITVLNISSSCAKMKLHGEDKKLYITAEDKSKVL